MTMQIRRQMLGAHMRASFGAAVGSLFPDLAARIASRLATEPLRGRAARRVPPGAEPVTFRFGLAGLRWGDGGPSVLALHGWQGRAAQFHELGQALAARGLRLVALDGPAHGRSPGAQAHPVCFADALAEVAPEVGPLHAVVGHSMGGGAALLALVNGLPASRAVVIGAPSAFGEVLRRVATRMRLPAAAVPRFLGLMERLTGVAPDALDIARLGASLDRPLLVVHDRDDAEVPFADGERIAALAGAELHATRGLGHREPLRDHATLARIVDFLVR